MTPTDANTVIDQIQAYIDGEIARKQKQLDDMDKLTSGSINTNIATAITHSFSTYPGGGVFAKQSNGAETIFPDLTPPPEINEAFAKFQEEMPKIEGEMLELCSAFYNKILETQPVWETVLGVEQHILPPLRSGATRRESRLFYEPRSGTLVVNTSERWTYRNDNPMYTGLAIGGIILLLGSAVTLMAIGSILAFLGILVAASTIATVGWHMSKTHPFIPGVYTMEQIAFGTTDIDLALNDRAHILSSTYEFIALQTAGYTEASLQASKRYSKLLR